MDRKISSPDEFGQQATSLILMAVALADRGFQPPPMMPQQQFNPYGGGFGGQRFQPPRMPQQQFNPYGGGFGGQRFQPPMMPQQQFNQFGGGFGGFNQAPNPYGGRQFMNPQILPFNMQPMTGTTMRDLKFGPPPSQQVRMDQPILQSGVTQGPFGLNSNSDVLVGNPLQGGGMMGTLIPDGTPVLAQAVWPLRALTWQRDRPPKQRLMLAVQK